jgi:ribosomal protein S18 acetylase RimI-like enzyme
VTAFRSATAADLPALYALDAVCFPPGDPSRKPAVPGEFENGVAGGLIRVCEVDGNVVGFVQLELPLPNHLYIGGLGVHPEFRRRGIGSRLVDQVLASEHLANRSISVVTAPDNHAMLRVLFAKRFVVRTILQNYFGPGAHRLYLQHYGGRVQMVPDERIIVPAKAWDRVAAMLESGDYVITALADLPADVAFEVTRMGREDLVALRSEEGSVGVSFSGSLLAAITFILGISFASSNFPNDVRILLIAATFATLLSLVIYANAQGDLARIRSYTFDSYMQWGNVLSEYGGVIPFLISLPVIFAQVSSSFVLALVTASVSAVAMLMYMHSRFSISSRYPATVLTRVLQVLICADPVLGILDAEYLTVAWPWTVLTIVVLAWLSYLYLYRNQQESLQRG